MAFFQSGNGLRAIILEELVSKEHMRKRLASLSFSEKIKILEKLRDRSLAIAASGLRRPRPGELRRQVRPERGS